MSSHGLPTWARELQTLLPVCSHFVLSGHVHDIYFGPGSEDDGPQLVGLTDLVVAALVERGIRLVVRFDITQGIDVVHRSTDCPDELVGGIVGRSDRDRGGGSSLRELADLIDTVATAAEPVGLVVENASRLVRRRDELGDEEFTFFRKAERACRGSSARISPSGRLAHSPVIWIVSSEGDMPHWFTVRNESLRVLVVPLPDANERSMLASNLLPRLAKITGYEGSMDRSVRLLTEQTAGMGLSAIRNTWMIARDQRLGPERVEDAARSYRVGVTENPWRAEFIADRLRAEAAGGSVTSREPIERQVIGQTRAVQKALDILIRSAAGLTAAQAGPSASRPRGVLFFAGPTGVGKTELAKAITRLLFDDDRFYVRFDMSEFSAEHAADRLIGAPPGYTGFEMGGELTNAIRQRPFSVVLLDEIEKAHERLLDKFLQVLDDGRLTDGRGDTVYFTEAVIVFTSNLGIYRDVADHGSPAGIRRELAVSPVSHPTWAEREAAVRSAIRDHFTSKLGRPELLNRIGEDNIVVFDFIDETTADRICSSMLANIVARVEREHGVALHLDPATEGRIRAACVEPGVLAMGGRGIGARLETSLINPLARLLTLEPRKEGAAVVVDRSPEDRWVATWA